MTNLKTGETLTEAQIAEAALSIGPRKGRSKGADPHLEVAAVFG